MCFGAGLKRHLCTNFSFNLSVSQSRSTANNIRTLNIVFVCCSVSIFAFSIIQFALRITTMVKCKTATSVSLCGTQKFQPLWDLGTLQNLFLVLIIVIDDRFAFVGIQQTEC